MTMEKLIGKRVTLTLRNFTATRSGPFAHLEGDTFDLEGVVMRRPHWEPDRDQFGFAVPHTEVPFRMVHIRNVVAIDGARMIQEQKTPMRTWKIKSSRTPEVYTVSESNGVWRCTCVANANFNKFCKHIKEAKEK